MSGHESPPEEASGRTGRERARRSPRSGRASRRTPRRPRSRRLAGRSERHPSGELEASAVERTRSSMSPGCALAAPRASRAIPKPAPQSFARYPLGRCERARELAARADPELAVRVREVHLDRLRRDVERLGDVAVGLPLGREVGDAALARRERLDAARERRVRGRAPGRVELGADVARRAGRRRRRSRARAPGAAARARRSAAVGAEAPCRAPRAPSRARAARASRRAPRPPPRAARSRPRARACRAREARVRARRARPSARASSTSSRGERDRLVAAAEPVERLRLQRPPRHRAPGCSHRRVVARRAASASRAPPSARPSASGSVEPRDEPVASAVGGEPRAGRRARSSIASRSVEVAALEQRRARGRSHVHLGERAEPQSSNVFEGLARAPPRPRRARRAQERRSRARGGAPRSRTASRAGARRASALQHVELASGRSASTSAMIGADREDAVVPRR